MMRRFDRSTFDEFLKEAEAHRYIYGRTDYFEALIAAGEFNLVDKDGNTALICSASNGHTNCVEVLIAAGADLNIVNKDGNTALMCAASKARLDCVKALIAAGADLNIVNKYGNTALMCAAAKRNAYVVHYINSIINRQSQLNDVRTIDYNTLPRVPSDFDSQAEFLAAVKDGNLDVVNQYIKKNPTALLDITDKNDQTALMYAAAYGHINVLAALCMNGANVNVKSIKGFTALMLAAMYGHYSIAAALISVGADVHINTASNKLAAAFGGTTALKLAIEHNHRNIVELIENAIKAQSQVATNRITEEEFVNAAGAGHLNVVTRYISENVGKPAALNVKMGGNTALMCAAEHGHTTIADALIAAHAKLDITNANGQSAFMIAARAGRIDVVKSLIKAGVNLNQVWYEHDHYEGQSALTFAVNKGDIDLVNVLLNAGAKPDNYTGSSCSPLLWAIKRGYTEIAIALINAGANHDNPDYYRMTPLMHAARDGRIEIAKALIRAGADLSCKTEQGYTALMFASRHSEMVDLIQSAMEARPLPPASFVSSSAAFIVRYFKPANKKPPVQKFNCEWNNGFEL